MGLAACGAAEWPPRSSSTGGGAGTAPVSRSVAAAPQAQASEARRRAGGDLTFIGANAVRIGPGDTLYAISRRHRVNLRALIEANGLEPPYLLRVNQRLVLPRGRQHRVAAGETVYAIAQKYDVEPNELARINGIRPPYTIRVGEDLLIPTGSLQSVRAPHRPDPDRADTASSAPGTSAVRATPPVRPKAPAETAGRLLPGPPKRSGQGFHWPVSGGRVISRFGGKQSGLRNDGINIKAPRGTPVVAAENGVVAYVGNELRGFGNLILVKHDGGWISAYAHTDRLAVAKGDRVRRGQKIATVGDTGGVDAPQLHFELRRNKRAVNPQQFLPPKAT
ncbi:MAG: M23 family peptidase [Rhodospirillales bacterium CG15_BIG_FIL_POST_REV_8_21_14_020_66_15]|nr:MAG: M23 family peptidase [Rhodospirillales bacterium CG15_BIG_FIL_POST_REV_8_21_14_020_66_15]